MFRAWLAMLLVVVLAAAQSGQRQLITVDVDLVNLYFTVCNSKGRLIADLGRESFSIFEDGAPQMITNFSKEIDLPLSIVLVFDTSGSVRDKLQFEKDAAIQFLNETLRPDRDKAALFTFDSFIELHQDFTGDQTLLANAVQRTRAGGGTRLYDALHFVLQEKLADLEQRKAIVLVTDGSDNSSRHSVQEVVDLAQRSNVPLYIVGMNALGFQWNDSQQSDTILRTLSAETGGRAFFPAKLEKLRTHFKKIGNELRSQYTIAYRSTNPQKDGTFRTVRIDVSKTGYSVRAKPGYYAPLEVAARR